MSKTDWINTYSGNSRTVKKFQAGGPMVGPPPEQGMGQGPDLEGMLQEYAQTRDPQLAVAICDTLVQLMAQQGGAPEAPMGRNGMKMHKAPIF